MHLIYVNSTVRAWQIENYLNSAGESVLIPCNEHNAHSKRGGWILFLSLSQSFSPLMGWILGLKE